MPQPPLHDPLAISIVFRGTPIVGFADGTFVSIERNEDAMTTHVGAGGDVVRVRNQNRTGRVTLTLLQTSPSNDVLTEAALLDETSGTGAGSLMVKDTLGRTIISAPYAWVVKAPAVEFAKEQSNREWVIECSNVQMTVGGA